jgi:hypothetical protein
MKELTKEDLQERAQLIRVHEANCGIEHPTDEERAFRSATMRKIAESFEFRTVKGFEMVERTPRATKPTAK